jgi:hypothetical protein
MIFLPLPPKCWVYRCVQPCMVITHIYFLVVLGFELRALHMPDRCFTTWAIPPTLTQFKDKETEVQRS